MFAVNPNADRVEGDECYHDLKSIPGGVDAVVIATRPETAVETMRECAELGIKHVWMHRSFGAGSVCTEAAEYGRQQGITVIDGGCPLMFEPVADPGHKVMRFVFTMAGTCPSRSNPPRSLVPVRANDHPIRAALHHAAGSNDREIHPGLARRDLDARVVTILSEVRHRLTPGGHAG